jgi:hypothetical protein
MGPMFGTSTVGCCLGILAPSLKEHGQGYDCSRSDSHTTPSGGLKTPG